jgi:hypothetical protein
MVGGRKGDEPSPVGDKAARMADALGSVRWLVLQNTLKLGARKQSGLAQPKGPAAVDTVAQSRLGERGKRPVAGGRLKGERRCNQRVEVVLGRKRFGGRASLAGGWVLLALVGECLHDSSGAAHCSLALASVGAWLWRDAASVQPFLLLEGTGLTGEKEAQYDGVCGVVQAAARLLPGGGPMVPREAFPKV